MPSTVFSILPVLPYWIFTITIGERHIITTILQTRELRLKEVWSLAQGHAARKESNLDKKTRFI